jgi:TnpA family transposase
VLNAQDGGQHPDIIVADSESYSYLVFGLVHPLGMQYRPQFVDLPDQQPWRIDANAGHGALNKAARGKVRSQCTAARSIPPCPDLLGR